MQSPDDKRIHAGLLTVLGQRQHPLDDCCWLHAKHAAIAPGCMHKYLMRTSCLRNCVVAVLPGRVDPHLKSMLETGTNAALCVQRAPTATSQSQKRLPNAQVRRQTGIQGERAGQGHAARARMKRPSHRTMVAAPGKSHETMLATRGTAERIYCRRDACWASAQDVANGRNSSECVGNVK